MDPGLKRAIRVVRESCGLTQQECAHRAGMSETHKWSNLEREHGRAKPPNLDQLDKIAQALDTTVEDLIRKAQGLRS